MLESRISPRATAKLLCSGETWCKHLNMVLWYGRSYKEMRGAVLRAGCDNNSATVQSLNSTSWWPSIQRRRIGIYWRIVKSMLLNCPEISVFGTYWWTRRSAVSKQTCTGGHKTDQSLWLTLGSFDFYNTLHEWIWAVLSYGKHSTTMQTIWGLWFCRRSWRLKIVYGRGGGGKWGLVYLWQSHVCSHQLDV